MSFKYAIAIICLFTHTMIAVLPSDIVFTPSAVFPTENYTELGYQLSYYTLESDVSDRALYFHHMFSDNIRYGLEAYVTSNIEQVYHHFSFRLGSLFHETDYESYFSGGINYLTNDSVNTTNQPLYDLYFTHSWKLLKSNFFSNITYAREIDSLDYFLIGSISYTKRWGTFVLGWDGSNLTLGTKFTVNDRMIFRNGLTRNIDNDSELIFKTSFGFIDISSHLFNNKRDKSTNDTATINETVDVAPGLEHLQLGIQYYYDGEYRKALKSYKLAAQFFSGSAIIHERLGSVYYKLGEYDSALLEWERAYAIEPSASLKNHIDVLTQRSKFDLSM